MNETIKYLLEREIERWIVVLYDGQPIIDKIKVDVKNDNMRFWEGRTVTNKLPLDELGLTENEAINIIKKVTLNSEFAFSDYPVTKQFKNWTIIA